MIVCFCGIAGVFVEILLGVDHVADAAIAREHLASIYANRLQVNRSTSSALPRVNNCCCQQR